MLRWLQLLVGFHLRLVDFHLLLGLLLPKRKWLVFQLKDLSLTPLCTLSGPTVSWSKLHHPEDDILTVIDMKDRTNASYAWFQSRRHAQLGNVT